MQVHDLPKIQTGQPAPAGEGGHGWSRNHHRCYIHRERSLVADQRNAILVVNVKNLLLLRDPINGMHPEVLALLGGDITKGKANAMPTNPAAHVRGFGLTTKVLKAHPAVFFADPDALDSHGNLTTVKEGKQPTKGDVMIKYEYTSDGFNVSFVVEQVLLDKDPKTGVSSQKYGVSLAPIIDNKCCGKIHDNLGIFWMVQHGKHELNDMNNMTKQDEAMVTKVLHIVCLVLIIRG
jgi:hypothetical protein